MGNVAVENAQIQETEVGESMLEGVDTYDLLGGIGMKETIVMVNGVFDLLHAGHIDHLIEASYMGTHLIVSLTNDAFVNKGPGRPVNTWHDRAHVLFSLRMVDDVIATDTAMDAIRAIRPTYFVKGIDYASGGAWSEPVEEVCRETGTIIRFTTAPKRSATEIIRRVHELSSHG
jgi:rfaE bifunctional protein nucleotidyltransferase chain/domain